MQNRQEEGNSLFYHLSLMGPGEQLRYMVYTCMNTVNGWQLAKMKKSIPDMSLPWNL